MSIADRESSADANSGVAKQRAKSAHDHQDDEEFYPRIGGIDNEPHEDAQAWKSADALPEDRHDPRLILNVVIRGRARAAARPAPAPPAPTPPEPLPPPAPRGWRRGPRLPDGMATSPRESSCTSPRLPPAVAAGGNVVALSPPFASLAAADDPRPRRYDLRSRRLRVADVGDENWVEIRGAITPTKGGRRSRRACPRHQARREATRTSRRSAARPACAGQLLAARQGFATVAGGGWPRTRTTTRCVQAVPDRGRRKASGTRSTRSSSSRRRRTSRKAKGDKSLAGHARASTPRRSKGFLQRTKEGKSRWYADALLLKATASQPDATRMPRPTTSLRSRSRTPPSAPSGRTRQDRLGLAEAQGDGRKAEQEFTAAVSAPRAR